jgi:hypothetical protein
MDGNSGYVNTSIFMLWLEKHVIPRKPTGKTVLLFGGHTSHCTDPDVLELGQKNGIVMICLPPHSIL